MRQTAIGFLLLACGVAFGFWPASGARIARTQNTVEACENCHGKDGASSESDVPIIGGLSAEYIRSSMLSFQKGERACSEADASSVDMCRAAKDLNKAEISEVAKYFARKKFVRAVQRFDAARAQKGNAIHDRNCERCHSGGGSVADDDKGILAGQWMPYLDGQFKDFASGKRPIPRLMGPMLKKVDREDIEALVNYYGSFK